MGNCDVAHITTCKLCIITTKYMIIKTTWLKKTLSLKSSINYWAIVMTRSLDSHPSELKEVINRIPRRNVKIHVSMKSANKSYSVFIGYGPGQYTELKVQEELLLLYIIISESEVSLIQHSSPACQRFTLNEASLHGCIPHCSPTCITRTTTYQLHLVVGYLFSSESLTKCQLPHL
jgi:hypothetical protein